MILIQKYTVYRREKWERSVRRHAANVSRVGLELRTATLRTKASIQRVLCMKGHNAMQCPTDILLNIVCESMYVICEKSALKSVFNVE